MIKIIYVGVGGFFGSISRYVLSGIIQRIFPSAIMFPVGTMTVNILGCLIIGMIAGAGEIRQVFNAETRVFLFVGFLGGFTTFSSFGFETFGLLRDQQFYSALSNIFLHILLGIPAVWLGFVMARLIFGE